MNNFPPELEAMILERAPANTLYEAQQVKKSWRSYIIDYKDKLRELVLSSEEEIDLYIIIWRIGRRPHMKFLWRKEIKMLQLTDYQFEICSCRILMGKLIILYDQLRLLHGDYTKLVETTNARSFIGYQQDMLTTIKFLHNIGSSFHQKEGKQEQIRRISDLCSQVMERISHQFPPHHQQVLLEETIAAKAVIAAYQPKACLNACKQFLQNITAADRSNPARLLRILYKLQNTAFLAVPAIAFALAEGLNHFRACLIANNLWFVQ